MHQEEAAHRPAPDRGPGRCPPSFGHAVERALAEALDAHGIRWEHEPHLFVLATDERGRVAEAIAPDFYLPDLDVYVECTVMREVTRKNRKVRKLRALYGVEVALLARRDFERLRDLYGLPIPLERAA